MRSFPKISISLWKYRFSQLCVALKRGHAPTPAQRTGIRQLALNNYRQRNSPESPPTNLAGLVPTSAHKPIAFNLKRPQNYPVLVRSKLKDLATVVSNVRMTLEVSCDPESSSSGDKSWEIFRPVGTISFGGFLLEITKLFLPGITVECRFAIPAERPKDSNFRTGCKKRGEVLCAIVGWVRFW